MRSVWPTGNPTILSQYAQDPPPLWKETLEKTWQRHGPKRRPLNKVMTSKYFLIPGGPHQVGFISPTAAQNSGSEIGRKVGKTAVLWVCFFNWQILHTEYNHQKRYVCLWNVDRLLQNLTWRRNRVGARQ